MERKTTSEIQAALAQPFAAEDLEWRLQMTFEDSMKGIAVPYVTNRAIMNRLDAVVGADRWFNDYRPWHGSGKKNAQLCGISVYFDDRGWVTKWDGAEDSDIEPVKGGLSDSMKRCAVQWGIGRVLYSMDETIYVGIEKRGRSFFIRKEERAVLDQRYLQMLQRLGLQPAAPCSAQCRLVRRDMPGTAPTPTPSNISPLPQIEFTVADVKTQQGLNGVSTSLVLVEPNGKRALGFARGEHPELKNGARLFNVRKTLQQQDSVVFYLLDSFEIANAA